MTAVARRLVVFVSAVTLIVCGAAVLTTAAQERGRPARGRPSTGGREEGVGGGHIPQRGPTPVQRPVPAPSVPASHRDQPEHPEAPHVHANNDEWVGHATGRADPRFHLDHPWEHGHFTRPIGSQHIWRLRGGDRNRFSIGGFYFQVAAPDAVFVNDWLWDNDDIVLYDDPDHDGWYLAYNVRLGTYVHVMYLGT